MVMRQINRQQTERQESHVTSFTFAAGSTTTTMTLLDDIFIGVTSDSAGTVKLPPVGAARGMFFTIESPNGSTNGLTIADNGDSPLGWSDIGPTNADNEYALLYSDGQRWHTLSTNIS